MTTANTPIALSQFSQKSIIKYVQTIFQVIGNNYNYRQRLLEQDLAYYREMDRTTAQQRAEAANWAGDASKVQNVVVPVVQPQVDSATAYLVETFLSSYPLFPIVADPDKIDAALQLETVLGQSAINFQWAKHLAMCFRDGWKYNLMAIECEWARETAPSVVTDTGQEAVFGTPKELIFEGNKLKRLDLYNTFFDSRVTISEIHKRGEFVGYSELITRMELKQLFLDLDSSLTMNATEAFQTPTYAYSPDQSQMGSYYVPQVNPRVFADYKMTGPNWLAWANLDTKRKIHYQDMYEKSVLYCRIIPKEHGIFVKGGKKNVGDPQIYKFIVINQKVVIFAQRMTNAHNMFPIVIGQPNEDGLNQQTKSFADNATPYQLIATALYNSGIHSQRRKVYDRIFYDPSKINKADIDRADPVARIPVKSDSFGKPISDAFAVSPYRDDGVANILGMSREVAGMADTSTGSNRVQQGQFQKGNKTRYEFDTVMSNSESRLRVGAILISVSWIHPIKEIVKYNILQYQPPAELFNVDKRKAVKVNPVDLRALAWEFQMADGTLPSSQLVNFELFDRTLQFASAVPAAGAEWDLLGMYAYQLKLQGARWVDKFHRTADQQQQFINNQRLAGTPLEQPGPIT